MNIISSIIAYVAAIIVQVGYTSDLHGCRIKKNIFQTVLLSL